MAPGTILQHQYLKHRLRQKKYKTFCEIGSGNGFLSAVLLKMGLQGTGYDLNQSACLNNEKLNKEYIANRSYKVVNGDFFNEEKDQKNKYDLIISCMVIEHLPQEAVDRYFDSCKKHIASNGCIVVFVPAAMKFWGIEDEIAGHFKRYEYTDFKQMAIRYGLLIKDLSGLTFPLSNMLLPFTNYLVKKHEGYKKDLSMQEQTILSGNRDIKFKTTFPWYTKLILNEVVLYPFYLLQRIFKNSNNAMVLYCELSLATDELHKI